jgi:predicted ATPase
LKINSIVIKNFKSIEDKKISFKKFTIFIGPNSSGKSSILQSLLILKRTLGKKPYSAQLITKTDTIELGEFKDIVTFHDLERKITFRINVDKQLSEGITENTPITANFWYEVTTDNFGQYAARFGGIFDNYEVNFNSERNIDTTAYCRDNANPESSLPLEHPSIEGYNIRMRCTTQNTEQANRFNRLFSDGTFTQEMMNDFHYVPFYRIATKYAELIARSQTDFLESNSDHLIQFLINNLSGDLNLQDKVSKLMQDLTGKSIRTSTYDLMNNDSGVMMNYVKNGFTNAITNEGTGPNQALLLLSVLVGTRDGSVIAIDEPEIHLHPSAQTKLANIIIDLGNKNSKQIMFTTHSEHMLFPFLASIASKQKGTLSKNDVGIYYVSIDEKTNTTSVEELEINEFGQIRGGLKGFWDSDLQSFIDVYGESDG